MSYNPRKSGDFFYDFACLSLYSPNLQLSKIKMELNKYAKNNLNLMIFKIFKNEPYDKFAFIKIGVKNLLNERNQKICFCR